MGEGWASGGEKNMGLGEGRAKGGKRTRVGGWKRCCLGRGECWEVCVMEQREVVCVSVGVKMEKGRSKETGEEGSGGKGKREMGQKGKRRVGVGKGRGEGSTAGQASCCLLTTLAAEVCILWSGDGLA